MQSCQLSCIERETHAFCQFLTKSHALTLILQYLTHRRKKIEAQAIMIGDTVTHTVVPVSPDEMTGLTE